jgi:1-deoxy-D-xylulose-5-phosphate reductoisomerase
VERLDLTRIGQFTFREAEVARYPALALARSVMETGGYAGAAFNAAKEAALDAFIDGRIGFLEMAAVVAAVLDKMSPDLGLQNDTMTLDRVQHTDRMARTRAAEYIAKQG